MYLLQLSTQYFSTEFIIKSHAQCYHFSLFYTLQQYNFYLVFLKVVVIYTAAGTHPIQNDYSHGSRFTCRKVYIHGCRAFSIKVLLTQQPFLLPKGLYTRLPCIKYKSAIYRATISHAKRFIYTAAIFHAKRLYTLLPCLQYEIMATCIYTTVLPKAKKTNSHIACILERKLIY